MKKHTLKEAFLQTKWFNRASGRETHKHSSTHTHVYAHAFVSY